MIQINNILEDFQKDKNATIEQKSTYLISTEPIKSTPQMHIFNSYKGHNNSTPRQKSRIHVLDFTTPSKISDGQSGKLIQAPKQNQVNSFS